MTLSPSLETAPEEVEAEPAPVRDAEDWPDPSALLEIYWSHLWGEDQAWSPGL